MASEHRFTPLDDPKRPGVCAKCPYSEHDPVHLRTPHEEELMALTRYYQAVEPDGDWSKERVIRHCVSNHHKRLVEEHRFMEEDGTPTFPTRGNRQWQAGTGGQP